MPTPQDSQPNIYTANDMNPIHSFPGSQVRLRERLVSSSSSFSGHVQPSPAATLATQRAIPSSNASASVSSANSVAYPGFMGRFLARSLPPLTHLHPALVHAQLTEARIRGMGARWAAPDIEEFLRRKLGNLRDANDDLVDDVDLTFLARHCVYCFGEGSGSRGDEI